MNLKFYFLKWLSIFLALACVVMYTRSLIDPNPSGQPDIISAAISIMFIFSSVRCGFAMSVIDDLEKKKHIEREGWFLSNSCAVLGLIGTIWGFTVVSQGFTGLDLNEQDSVKNLLTSMGAGIGVALHTTLIGQVAAQILGFQYFELSQVIEAISNEKVQ